MMRWLILGSALVFFTNIASASSLPEPHDTSLATLGLSAPESFTSSKPTDLMPGVDRTAAEERVQIARKGRRGGGGARGGSRRRHGGGFNAGSGRHGDRMGERRHEVTVQPHHRRDVDIDREVNVNRNVDVDVDRDWDDDDWDDNAGAAIVGGVIGLGVGAAIANSDDPEYVCPEVYSNDPDYVCPDVNNDGYCDCNVPY